VDWELEVSGQFNGVRGEIIGQIEIKWISGRGTERRVRLIGRRREEGRGLGGRYKGEWSGNGFGGHKGVHGRDCQSNQG